MPDRSLRPGHPDDVCPPSEMDGRPSENRTDYQKFRSYAAEHKDDGWGAPVSSDDPPPSYGT